MEPKEMLVRVQRAKSLLNTVAVAGKPALQAMLIAINDLETVECRLQFEMKQDAILKQDQEEA